MNDSIKRGAQVLCLLVGMLAASARAEDWPTNVPVIEPQPDGVIYLNAEAAGFMMEDREGRHVMNHIHPALELVDGRLLHLGRERQLPAWQFKGADTRWYRVVANMNIERIEPMTLRVSLEVNGKERRVLKALTRSEPGTGVQAIDLGRARLEPGDVCAMVLIWRAWHMGRLPEIQDIRLIPEGDAPPEAETRAYDKIWFPQAPEGIKAKTTVFPTGRLDRLPKPESKHIPPEQHVVIPPPPDVEARRRAFERRNDAEGLAALSRRLQNALVPGTPGLELFEQAMANGRHAVALEAYRAYFFAKLKQPALHGAEGIEFFASNGKRQFIRQPDEREVERQVNGAIGRFVLGPPGSVNWAPATLCPPEGASFGRGPDGHAFWNTPEGKEMGAQITFFQSINRLNNDHGGSPFNELLLSYLMKGDIAHLHRYAAYMEDWAMHAATDLDNAPVNMRAAVELQVIGAYLNQLRVILDERPALARDFPAPALARILLYITESHVPYVVRAKRAELANWGIMGLGWTLRDTRLMHEFRAMRYMNREAIRLARMNMIQHLSLDGAGLEAWDEGHMGIDGMLRQADESSLFGAPVMGDLERQSFLDHCKVFQRSLLTHLSPEGQYWVPWLTREEESRITLSGRTMGQQLLPDIFDESEARRRIYGALNKESPDPRPPRSDIMPYAFLSYTRDGFGPGMAAAIMQNFPARSQTQDWGINTKRGHIYGSQRTQYSVSRDGRSLGQGSAIYVNRRPPDRWVDATRTGGKTEYSFKTPRNIVPSRFLTSDAFDFVETEQDSPYRQKKNIWKRHFDMLDYRMGEPDETIRDVTAVRQLIQLRDAGIFLIGDRVNNPASDREFAKFFVLPVHAVPLLGNATRFPPTHEQNMERLEGLAARDLTLFDVDAGQRRLRTGSPGLLNTSVYLAGQDVTFGGVIEGNGEFASAGSFTASNLLERTRAQKKHPEQYLSGQAYQIVSARWNGSGPQAQITVMVTRDTRGEQTDAFADDITDFRDISADGAAGCSFLTQDGIHVAYVVSPEGARRLKADEVTVHADTLFFSMNPRSKDLNGLVVGGNRVEFKGRTYRHKGDGDAFAFNLAADGTFSSTPIQRPIDTTIISPQQTVFTDHVEVTFDIPTQDTGDIEFRYTLDGSDPTPQSALYTGPVRITEDTRVKVRPFRKGVTNTLWTTAGVDAGKTMWAIFRKQAPKPATTGEAAKPGLAYQYFEGPWSELVSQSGMYPYFTPVAEGRVAGLLDADEVAAIRQTDRAYQVKYIGTLTVPETGVYTFYAPEHLFDTDMDAGYDLRVWVDGEEWFPNPDLHAENIWSVALEKGAHRFEVSFTDYRWKEFRNEYRMGWYEEQMWQGTPVLELDGPGVKRQPVPAAWLSTR